jgi:hypothetical protein
VPLPAQARPVCVLVCMCCVCVCWCVHVCVQYLKQMCVYGIETHAHAFIPVTHDMIPVTHARECVHALHCMSSSS